MENPTATRLTSDAKSRLLDKIRAAQGSRGRAATVAAKQPNGAPEQATYEFSEFWEYKKLEIHREVAERAGIPNPFFLPQEGISENIVVVNGCELINFSSYNYLGLCGDQRVSQAAVDAIERYGTSAGASRIVSGEKPVHRALETKIAEMLGVEAAITMVSGHATNVTTIATLFGPDDLIIYDWLSHNSILEGAKASGAKIMVVPHNDCKALDSILARTRRDYKRVLIVIEGIYSMDGDLALVDEIIAIKRRHKALLMIDEAHSIGIVGEHGRGVVEHFGLAGSDIDIWMGTLSKSLAGCGGYIAGSHALIELLKYTAPGFVYSVGMSPPVAAAALAALEIMQEETWRTKRLNRNAKMFRDFARERDLDVGLSDGLNIVPVIVEKSLVAGKLSEALFKRGINVHPIIYPAVQEQAARLRFFVSSQHEEEQIRTTVDATAEELERILTLFDIE